MPIGKQKLKIIQSLKQAKFRKKLGLFSCEGNKSVAELLASNVQVTDLLITEEWQNRYPEFDHKLIEPMLITHQQMQQISNLSTPPGIFAVAQIPQNQISPEDAKNHFILVLDGINDPGNLGTIIRTADWFGVGKIILSDNSVDIWNPKVVQATMGSVFRVSITESYLPDYLQELNKLKLPVYGALLNGEALTYSQDKIHAGALIIGSESHGISASVLPYITHPVLIPRHEQSKAESLNAAVATAILLSALSSGK